MHACACACAFSRMHVHTCACVDPVCLFHVPAVTVNVLQEADYRSIGFKVIIETPVKS